MMIFGQIQNYAENSEKVDIIQTRLYRHNALTPDDYKDMLKDADALYNTACEIVDYIQEESYPE